MPCRCQGRGAEESDFCGDLPTRLRGRARRALTLIGDGQLKTLLVPRKVHNALMRLYKGTAGRTREGHI